MGPSCSDFRLPIDDFTRGTVKYGYDDTDISEVPEDAALEIKEMEGQNITSSMTFAITRDSRDKLWDTSRGSYNRLRFEYAGGVLGGDIGFNKYIAKTGWYFPLFWDTVFLVKGTWGLVVQRPGEVLPVYQKFQYRRRSKRFVGLNLNPFLPEILRPVTGSAAKR